MPSLPVTFLQPHHRETSPPGFRHREGSVIGELGKVVYWHRDLPPLDADAVGEHVIEATSEHERGTVGHHDDLWERCYRGLMAHTTRRLEQEVARLGGDYARVLREAIEPRHDEVKNEGWLYGRFSYELYRKKEH